MQCNAPHVAEVSITVPELWNELCMARLFWQGGRPLCSQILTEQERPPSITLGIRKLETLGYPTVKTTSFCIPLFWHNTKVWPTDRRTDGRICYSIYSACKASFATRRKNWISRSSARHVNGLRSYIIQHLSDSNLITHHSGTAILSAVCWLFKLVTVKQIHQSCTHLKQSNRTWQWIVSKRSRFIEKLAWTTVWLGQIQTIVQSVLKSVL